MGDRLLSRRLDSGVQRGELVEFFFDGQTVKAFQGEDHRHRVDGRRTPGGWELLTHGPRGVYCNIGVCHSCVMTVDGIKSVPICTALVTNGCRVESQHNEKGKIK